MNDMTLFPAKVTLPDGRTIRPAMVTVRGGVLEVFAHRADAKGEDVGRRIVRAYIDRGLTPTDVTPSSLSGMTSGGVVTVVSVGGCGCGHPLKRFRPPPVPKAVP